MSSRVTVSNRSDLNFKASVVLFSEIENSVEKFWESKSSDLIKSGQEGISFGKLIHPGELPNSANFIVSIILSAETLADDQAQESFLILKSRIKSSKSGAKIYTYASSFPEGQSLTKPQWHKGSSKNYFMANFMSKIIQITCFITWNNNISFVIDQLDDVPVFCKLLKSLDDHIIEDFYENEWKSKTPGNLKYTHHPISMSNHRPPFSTINGGNVLPRSQIMPPSPNWIWIDDWHLDYTAGDQEGWIYLDDWKSSHRRPENSTKFRLRRWIRTRAPKKKIAEKERNDLEFISKRFLSVVSFLENSFPPFLRELKKEVNADPKNFDFRSVAAIPSPRLRRELKIYGA